MNSENLKYIADLIIHYVKGIEAGSINALSLEDYFLTDGTTTAWDKLESPSEYPKPDNLSALLVIKRIANLDRVPYCSFDLLFDNNKPTTTINVRWHPFKKIYHRSSKGRKPIPRQCFFGLRGTIDLKEKKLYLSDDLKYLPAEFRNLIIVDTDERQSQRELLEVALQVGIYFLREGVFKKEMELYPLFIKATNRFKKNEGQDDTNIFKRLLKRYLIPTQATSFRAYMYAMLNEVRRQSTSHAIGTTKNVEFYGGEDINVEGSGQYICGVPNQTVYTLIRRGKLKIPPNGYNHYDWEKGKGEIENYKKQRGEGKLQKALANRIADEKNIAYRSAQRQIQRLKKQGLTLREIIEKLKQ